MRPPTCGSTTVSATGASRMWWSGGHQLSISCVKRWKARSIGASTTIDLWTEVVAGACTFIVPPIANRLRSLGDELEDRPPGGIGQGGESINLVSHCLR